MSTHMIPLQRGNDLKRQKKKTFDTSDNCSQSNLHLLLVLLHVFHDEVTAVGLNQYMDRFPVQRNDKG